jgi:hypothetical protein
MGNSSVLWPDDEVIKRMRGFFAFLLSRPLKQDMNYPLNAYIQSVLGYCTACQFHQRYFMYLGRPLSLSMRAQYLHIPGLRPNAVRSSHWHLSAVHQHHDQEEA